MSRPKTAPPEAVTPVQYLVDCACADMAIGMSRARAAKFASAARLLARAQGVLAKAEIRLHELARAANQPKETTDGDRPVR